ncbi:MAG: hypothetical protein KDC34_10475 [Saprospiraceae bacterium]|nr:hypothetical protein [Saprospiraceae bacterium]
MKKLLFLLALASFAAFSSCGGEAGSQNGKLSPEEQITEETTLYDEIIATHDKLMLDMITIRNMSKALEKRSAEVTEDEGSNIKLTLGLLGEAEESMMSWMQELGPANPQTLRASASHDEIMQALAIQEENAAVVGKKINDAVAQASNLLKKLSSENGINLSPSK